MRSLSMILPRAALLAASVLLSGAQAADQPKLDEGRLDPAWFGTLVEFRTTSTIDYVWVKPDFTCKGKALRIEKWPDPVFLGKERRGRDAAQAFELTDAMPLRIRSALQQALKGYAEISSEGGDLILSGRVVD